MSRLRTLLTTSVTAAAFTQAAPAENLSLVGLDINVSVSEDVEWIPIQVLLGPECVEVLSWQRLTFDACQGWNRLLECWETRCGNPPSVAAQSPDCTYCQTTECCDDFQLPEPPQYIWEFESVIDELIDDSINLQYLEHLAAEHGLPHYGPTGAQGYDANRQWTVTFERSGPSAAATVEIQLATLDLLLDARQAIGSMSNGAMHLEIVSPQLGTLFSIHVEQGHVGLAQITGDVPTAAFERASGRAELSGYQVPPISVPVPAGLSQIEITVQCSTDAAAQYDRNGNGIADPQDIIDGTSLDENGDAIPDEVQPFGLLHAAVGNATLGSGQNDALVVANIGSSGEDGVAVDLDGQGAYRAELGELPPIESLAAGDFLRMTLRGVRPDETPGPLGSVTARRNGAGGLDALANFGNVDGAVEAVVLRHGDEDVASFVPGPPNQNGAVDLGLWPGWMSAAEIDVTEQPDGSYDLGLMFEFDSGVFTLPGGQQVTADRAVVNVGVQPGNLISIDHVLWRARGLGMLRIDHERIRVDLYGACCIDFSCDEITWLSCWNLGGDFQGLDSECPAECPMILLGSCCINYQCYDDYTSQECSAAGGTFLGAFTHCFMHGDLCEPLFCTGDTDLSGEVNVIDLTNVILDWGTDGAGHNGDVDGDGAVDVKDITEVILNWGGCPN